MGRRARSKADLDTELADLPPELRWREWMGRVEAVIFASPAPVTREVLTRVVGRDCNLDLIIDDIRDELRGRPYELVSVAGGWQHRTRKNFAEAIRAAIGTAGGDKALSQTEALILACIAYYQPINRSELSSFFGKEVSRDTIARLRGLGFIASGPRSPQPGAPYTYVTTKGFLSHFGLETLRDLPDMEALEDAGLLSKDKMLAGEF
ncbi:SMC-Scp complex subunit ScpB, partial [Bradyrhizobium sp. Leo121]|uniref:SMC-Scp complex subunit ScpB n=1 Tax=Bradyrhizobium sp. Leo121 TaxID=1571195 RepID=UPI00102A34A2